MINIKEELENLEFKIEANKKMSSLRRNELIDEFKAKLGNDAITLVDNYMNCAMNYRMVLISELNGASKEKEIIIRYKHLKDYSTIINAYKEELIKLNSRSNVCNDVISKVINSLDTLICVDVDL